MKACTNCGAENPDSAKFCKKCGKSLDDAVEGEVVDAPKALKKGSNVKTVFEGIGGFLIMLVVFAALIFLIFAFIKGATFLGEKLLPILVIIVIPLLIIELCVVLPLALSKKLKGTAGVIVYIGSYVYGLTAWLIGFIVTLYYWGVFWVIVGLFIAGIGVVPFGVVAGGFNGQWAVVFNLIVLSILTYGSRMLGAKLAEDADIDI